MAVIFPFEKKFFQDEGIKSYYVGHPLVQNNTYKRGHYKNKDYIGFFPGSRLSEIKNHLPMINRIIESMHEKILH